MKTAALVLLIVAFIAGCVSTRNAAVSDDRTRDWNGKTVALTTRPRADFVAMTAGKAAFALIGAAAMISAGNSIVEKNGIENPSPILSDNLLSDAERHYGVVAAVPARDCQKFCVLSR
jgi:hypothetical protein